MFNLPAGTRAPDHVAIIPDGNRRWARARGWRTLYGHRRGFDLVPELVRAAREMGVHTLTLWAFSTENWDRSREEIRYLMKLYESMIERNLAEAHQYEARIVHLGRKDRIPASLVQKIIKAEVETEDYRRYVLNIALDYGGHDEIKRAIGRLIEKLRLENNSWETGLEVWEEEVGRYAGKYPIYGLANYLDTAGQPYPFPDLLIRTSGEQRTSGLLNWQTAYTELYFEPAHFPDFTPEKLRQAVLEYSRRRRRFGGNDKGRHLVFDPQAVGLHEARAWRALGRGDWERAKELSVTAYEALYHLTNGVALESAEQLIKARRYAAQKEWRRAEAELQPCFQAIKKACGFAYEVHRMSALEVAWWRLQAELKPADDPFILEEGLTEALAEQFGINRLQVNKAARLKLLALSALSAQSAEVDKHVALSEMYWVRSYQALKEMVA